MAAEDRIRDLACTSLAWIRIVNGLLALIVPGLLSRRLGIDPDASPAIRYVFRMFGIRTVLIGTELLLLTGERRAEAARTGILIHASDTVAAFAATRSHHFPTEGRAIVWISAVNTVLAIVASR